MTFEARELSPDRSVRDLFGAELRRHREQAGMSLRRLSEVVNYSKSQLARIEAAESLPYDDLPTKLDACFGTGELFARLHTLAKREPFPGKYRRVISEIESRAAVIEEYASATIPGLLQTRELAEKSLRCGNPYASDAEVASLVRARIDRQALLDKPKPPRCWFILDEAVLRRPVGEPEVMRQQMSALVEVGMRPHLTIQLLPFAAGGHAEAGSSLMLYTLPHQPLTAYEEGSHSGTIIENQSDVAIRRENYDLLRAMALSPRDAEAMIRVAMEDWTPCEPPLT
ncbi:helix-turn-helix domain-containing protein [Streptomyces decoyicus]|uniref:helix-turn-helix domain-containing protein n=1 Tax=Streptomyces decoyicus TaxID=249567 RepID=UPI0004AB25E3|nr:helix-turn-helix transcriptional regulator [Streptomyces decoyicus]KOG39749.1 DNA-binding protein [Streptomyces decoyicus]QZY17923.1 helix-turn-helix domain-containing protein [Streptomyces decoyicus]